MTPRFVFIAGLHRTGTSLLAGLLAQHDAIGAIDGAPVPEQEGCYLQGAIPHTARHGIPGRFATDPMEHYTEAHALNTMETRDRIRSDWCGWFDQAKPWHLEKSPVNLTRMRLLQALFPLAKFVVILRHPQYMAAALRKWSERDAAALTAYGVAAYDIMAGDLPYLHSHLVIRYEDLVRRPERHMAAIHTFLDLPPQRVRHDCRDGNADYERPGPGEVGGAVEAMARWGYGAEGVVGIFEPIVADPLRHIANDTRAAFISREKIGGN